MKTFNDFKKDLTETIANSMGGNFATGQVGDAGNLAGYNPVMNMGGSPKKKREKFAGCEVFKLNSEERHNHNVNWLPFRKDYYLSSNRLKIAGEPQPNYIHIQNMDTGFTSTCESAMEKWAKAILLIRIKE